MSKHFSCEHLFFYSLFFDPWHQGSPLFIIESFFSGWIYVFLFICATDFSSLKECIHDEYNYWLLEK